MLDVVIGRDNDLLSGGAARSVPVKQRWIHPKYNRTTFEYDFAILLLDHPIHQIIIIDDNSSNNNNDTSNSNGDDEKVSSAAAQVPIQLVTLNPNNTYPPPGTTSHVLGWGDTTGNKTFTNILQMANVDVITNTECSAATRNNDGTGSSSSGSSYKGCIYDSMICTFQEGKDSCQGDSGGPVIVQQEQQHLNGTTTTTVDVQIGVVSWGYGCAQMPGVDSRVSMGYDWIQETACGWSNDTSGSSLCDDDDSSLVEELQSSTPTYQPSNTAVPTTTSSSTLAKSSAVPTFEAGNRVDPEDQTSSSSPTAVLVAVEGEPSDDDDDDIISSLAPTTTSSIPYPSSSSSLSAAPMIVITNTPTLYLATIRNEDGEEDSNDVSSSSNAPSTFPTWVLPNPSPTNVVIE